MKVLLLENTEEQKFTLANELWESYEKDGELVYKCVKALVFFKIYEIIAPWCLDVETIDIYNAWFYMM